MLFAMSASVDGVLKRILGGMKPFRHPPKFHQESIVGLGDDKKFSHDQP